MTRWARKISTTVYLEPAQDEALKLLNARTKVPVSQYIRDGIDLILAQHGMLDVQPKDEHEEGA